AVGAYAQAGVGEVVQLGGFADQIDAAARAATAAVDAVRAFDDFDLFQVEHLARGGADVAHAVHESAGLGIVTADEGAVAQRIAAFAGTEGDARGVAQHIGQRYRSLVLNDLLGDDLNGLGRIDQGSREFLRGRLLDVVSIIG